MKFVFSIILIIVSFTNNKAQECQIYSPGKPNMGVNLPSPSSLPWINLWHQAFAYALGDTLWPVPGKVNELSLQAGMIPVIGTVKISYKGTTSQFLSPGNVTIQVKRDDFPKPGYAYFELILDIPADSSILMLIDGHIEDIKIMRPGFELTEARILHPDYTEILKNFSTLRFMEVLQANSYETSMFNAQSENSINQRAEWKNRPLPEGFQTDLEKGAAWEHVIAIANELKKDIWINIPVKATDDYIIQLATLLKSTFDPTLNVNIEIGNELWNIAGGFNGFRQVKEMVILDKRSNDPIRMSILGGANGVAVDNGSTEVSNFAAWKAFQRWPARRLKEVVSLFGSVYGESQINETIRGILCGQFAYGLNGHGFFIEPGLDFIKVFWTLGEPRLFLRCGSCTIFVWRRYYES